MTRHNLADIDPQLQLVIDRSRRALPPAAECARDELRVITVMMQPGNGVNGMERVAYTALFRKEENDNLSSWGLQELTSAPARLEAEGS